MKEGEAKYGRFMRPFFLISQLQFRLSQNTKNTLCVEFGGFFKANFKEIFFLNFFLFQLSRGNDVEYLD